MKKRKEFYRRNLPHWQPKNAVLFITTNLHGSLPQKKIQELKTRREEAIEQLRILQLPEDTFKYELSKIRDLYFGKFDHLLDNNTSGPHWLKEDRIAKIWIDSLMHFDKKRYKLICSTIMSNHVHFIFYKLDRNLPDIMKSLKGYSGYLANKVLMEENPKRQKGDSFWQEEPFDTAIRDRDKLKEKILYTLNNPVKVGLAPHWKAYKWNYIHPDFLKFTKT